MNKHFIRYWKSLVAVVFWGTSFIATKIALEKLDPITIVFIRLILASAFLFLIAHFTKRSFSITLKNVISILLLALIASFHLWIQVTGLKYTSASNTGWIIGTSPIFIAILGFFVFAEKLTLFKITGILISFFGLLLLIGKGDLTSIDLISNKGDFLVLSSALTWGIYSMINKKVTLNYPPMMTILFQFLMMAIIILPFNLSGRIINSILTLNLEIWSALIFLGLFCSGIAYVFWAQALKEMESAKVGAFLYFEPFVTVIAAFLILKENINILTIISGLTITAGVILVNLNPKILFRYVTRYFQNQEG